MITTYLTLRASTVFATFCVIAGAAVAGFLLGEASSRSEKVKLAWIPAIIVAIATVFFLILLFLLL